MRWILRIALWSLVAFGLPARAEDKPIAIRDLLSGGLVASMTISPDGKWVAGVGASYMSAVFIQEVDTGQATVIARSVPDKRWLYGSWPRAVHWIAKDLLAVDYSGGESFSVDLKGKRIEQLGERFIRRLDEKGPSSDWVLAYRDVDDGDIDAVNARTGERRKYRVSLPGKIIHWAFDAAGTLRAVTMMDTAYWAEKTKINTWYRADEQAPWQLLEEVPITADHLVPLRALPEPHTLAVLSRHDRDTYAVFRYDTEDHRFLEVMAGHPNDDIVEVSGLDHPSFEYVTTAGIKPRISWFDSRWASLQGAIDAVLPGRINLLEGDKNGRVLITSYGDVDPGRWYVFDTKTSVLREIVESRPRIDPKQMRPMEIFPYVARDGTTVQSYLSRPARAAQTPAPMVVLIHGGPYLRDHWQWNEEVQLLASRGYVVFQPQFRGSTGFGRRFLEAGYRQWGRAMQDDITDGVQQLIERKVADPERICISGASYGGYAALWGVIKTPQLYKCGISFAGLSDLGEHISHSIMDDSTAASRELNRAHIGDPKQSRQALDEVSPLKHAAEVRVPLLIAHGERDTRVLPSQSKAMVNALKAQGKAVEWLPFEKEGHGFFYVNDEVAYYEAMLGFLKKHIGETPPAAEAKAASGTPP